ncbi:MAG: AAA family ATPase [Dehalococcoidia bacterium]|nr:AAA family ATPase [Dehalococcoidia bacterium]
MIGKVETGMWGIAGNERAVAAVARAVADGSCAHAYLFVGPERVGKAATAGRLAQAVNCVGAAVPCLDCRACTRIGNGIHADVQTVTVEPGEDGAQRTAISVEQVREIERAVALNPFEGKTRVVILDPADEMSPQAQNAFLKTLEEPPPHVIFVLIARREERLLETVRSRCRRIGFSLAPVAVIERVLLEREAPPEQARLLARLSRGRAGWALEMASDAQAAGRRREALESARALARMTVAQRLDLAERLSDDFKRDREGVLTLLAQWQDWWRDVLLTGCGAEEGMANLDMAEELREDAARHGAREAAAFVQALREARQQLEENVQSRVALEALVLQAPTAALPAGQAGPGAAVAAELSTS